MFLSVVHVNDFADVVGAPRYGFLISALGCAVLLGVGLATLPSSSPRAVLSLAGYSHTYSAVANLMDTGIEDALTKHIGNSYKRRITI